jgi:hypothetical protein
MVLKFRKLAITFGLLLMISLMIGVFFRASIFASDVIVTNNNASATLVENLSLPSQLTLSPLDAENLNLGKEIHVSKAYRIYYGDKIFGELLLSDSSSCSNRLVSNVMISHISGSFPFIVRNRFENGSGKGKIAYREWGVAKNDDSTVNYQNLIIKNKNVNCYLILYYKGSYGSEVDHMLRSVNFSS